MNNITRSSSRQQTATNPSARPSGVRRRWGAVLLFVFVIRPLLTAPLLHVLGRWAWWPLAVPQPQQPATSAKTAAEDGREPRRQDAQAYE